MVNEFSILPLVEVKRSETNRSPRSRGMTRFVLVRDQNVNQGHEYMENWSIVSDSCEMSEGLLFIYWCDNSKLLKVEINGQKEFTSVIIGASPDSKKLIARKVFTTRPSDHVPQIIVPH